MPRRKSPAIPPAPRMSLREWIEHDDGDTTSFTPPACSRQAQALYAQILYEPGDDNRETGERLASPSGLHLPPLG